MAFLHRRCVTYCPYHHPKKDVSPTAQSGHLQLSEAQGLPLTLCQSLLIVACIQLLVSAGVKGLAILARHRTPLAGHSDCRALEVGCRDQLALLPPSSFCRLITVVHPHTTASGPPPQRTQNVGPAVQRDGLAHWLALRTHRCVRLSTESPEHKAKAHLLKVACHTMYLERAGNSPRRGSRPGWLLFSSVEAPKKE